MKKSIVDFFSPRKPPNSAAGESSASSPLISAVDSKSDEKIEDTPVSLTGWTSFDSMHPSWLALLRTEFDAPYFTSLRRFVDSERASSTIFPPDAEVFTAFKLCPFESIKVVILGQDPYHEPGQAHGLAFSVKPGVAIPPSLRNMIKEAISDVSISQPSHGCLEHWSRQGVFLLNTVLTVRSGDANSHKDHGWERFTDKVISSLSSSSLPIVFLLWGKPAQSKSKLINQSRHAILCVNHPSPLSANKQPNAFIGSKVFSRANEILTGRFGREAIDWSLDAGGPPKRKRNDDDDDNDHKTQRARASDVDVK